MEKINQIKEKLSKVFSFLKRKFSTRHSNNWISKISMVLIYAVLIVICYVFLSPLIDILSKSFMGIKDLINPEVFYVPTDFTFANYSSAVSTMSFMSSLWNSIWFSALLATFQVIVSAVTAYAFARYNFKGKKIMFGLLVLVFILPTPILVNSRKMMIDMLQNSINFTLIQNGFFGNMIIIIMTMLGQGVYSTILILIFYNFFKQIPYDLDEAAYMDGANSFGVLYHVILKLSMPVIFTVFLFSFVWNWNETLQTSIFISSDFKLLPFQVNNIPSTYSEGVKMAGTILSIMPLIILYLFVQRKFIEGIEQTGITGV